MQVHQLNFSMGHDMPSFTFNGKPCNDNLPTSISPSNQVARTLIIPRVGLNGLKDKTLIIPTVGLNDSKDEVKLFNFHHGGQR